MGMEFFNRNEVLILRLSLGALLSPKRKSIQLLEGDFSRTFCLNSPIARKEYSSAESIAKTEAFLVTSILISFQ